jgi:hypothetical protein
MLTDHAIYERKWGRYPSLGRLLVAHQVPDHYYGWSSVSDNVFDWLDRVAKTAVVTKEHAAILRGATDPQLIKSLPDELHELELQLVAAARFFTEHAEVVHSLLLETYEREHQRHQEELQHRK